MHPKKNSQWRFPSNPILAHDHVDVLAVWCGSVCGVRASDDHNFFSRQRDCSDDLGKKTVTVIETRKIFDYNFSSKC